MIKKIALVLLAFFLVFCEYMEGPRPDDDTATSSETPVPKSVSGLVMWFHPETIVLLNNKVIAWDDDSDLGNYVLQPFEASRPLKVENQLNSYDVVSFNSTNSQELYRETFDLNYKQDRTIFIVFSTTSSGVLQGIYYEWGPPEIDIAINTQNQIQAAYYNPFNTPIDGEVYSPTDYIQTNTFYILTYEYNYSNYREARLYINGSQLDTASVTNPANFQTQPVLGKVSGNYFTGYLAEVIIYEAAMSYSDRDKIEEYLSEKYQITLYNY